QPARTLQTRVMQRPGVIDAAPHGGYVRLVMAPGAVDVGSPAQTVQDLKLQPTDATLEDGFMVLLRERLQEGAAGRRFEHAPSNVGHEAEPVVVEVRDLVRKFGEFTAVDRTSFAVRRGEVFGLLGPNGAGKTTTFRMLCGLLPATSGTLRVAGADLRRARAQARQRIGYVAQKFALYGNLTVRENLEFFAGAYGLRNRRLRERLDWALEQFELGQVQAQAAEDLPGGY